MLKLKEFDVQTVTASDYSVEVTIPEEVFEKFENEEYPEYMKNEEKPGNMENEVVVTMFRMWIRKRIKEILDQMENLNFEKDFKEVNIVYTSFAY